MQITYLFGAGASCGALPIVNQIPDALSQTAKDFASMNLEQEDRFIKIAGKPPNDYRDQFVSDLQYLSEESRKHASIDTFAKKLYLNQKFEKLRMLKNAFSAFMCYQQAIRPCEERYDAFFASILNDNIIKFPDNISILFWNYDMQFEKSYAEFTDNQILSRVYSKFQPFEMEEGFKIIKLNGMAGFRTGDHNQTVLPYCNLFSKFSKDLLRDICYSYALCGQRNGNQEMALSFAWENDRFTSMAGAAVESTKVLVVIGYSFPYFNREIDRQIIRRMERLKKIYFQSPEAHKLMDRIKAIVDTTEIELVPITDDMNQFFLPHEL